MKKKTEIAQVAKDKQLSKTTEAVFIPDPALKEAFIIFACGFKLGAVFGFAMGRRRNQTDKAFSVFLESPEAQQLIYSILLKEDDFAKGAPS